MHPFASYVLRTYYSATGWNEDNLYSNLTRSSNALLDFSVPRGLHFAVSKSANSLFRTSYSMNALPSLNGSVGYIFTNCELGVRASRDVRFKEMVDRFKVYDQPRRPEGKPEEWLAGERVDERDYLMYGRVYLPTGKLDALYTTRVTPTLQALVAAISEPARGPGSSNLMVSLQHDVGRTCTEYSWSAEDSMWGIRLLHNFGKLATSPDDETDRTPTRSSAKPKRVDEEEAMEGGLKGRISAGAEVYFSAKEKSAGVSTGIRFTTLPDATPPSFQLPSASSLSGTGVPFSPSQPPTTITALFNPMLGHMSGAYAARVHKDLSLCSRFDFNVYSYESEWTMGAEWWIRRNWARPAGEPAGQADAPVEVLPAASSPPLPSDKVHGVIKARASTSNDVSLMWEGRIQNLLVSVGVVSNLSSRVKPIKAIGLELSYFTSD